MCFEGLSSVWNINYSINVSKLLRPKDAKRLCKFRLLCVRLSVVWSDHAVSSLRGSMFCPIVFDISSTVVLGNFE